MRPVVGRYFLFLRGDLDFGMALSFRKSWRYSFRETRHLPSAEATEEGPCKIVLSLERAHRPAQQQNRQEELDNLAENLDNDGVEITVVHDHQLLEAARSLSTTTVIGPFCFFRLTRDVPTTAASKRIRNCNSKT